MTPLYFGPSQTPLFGVFHPAQVRAARAPGVVLCNPFGVEAIRSYRVFRILAEKLSRAGSPVLRFDYRGTGDSSGDCTEATLSGATEDIVLAHQELMDMSGVQRVIWIGLRLGATLSMLAAQNSAKGLAGLILWDPVILGKEYLAEQKRAHIAGLAGVFDQSEGYVLSQRKSVDFSKEALGFELGETFSTEMNVLDLTNIPRRPARSVAIVSDCDMSALGNALQESGAKVSHFDDEEAQSWNSDAALNAFVVPTKTLDLLLTVTGELR